jgi:hypothetical protein
VALDGYLGGCMADPTALDEVAEAEDEAPPPIMSEHIHRASQLMTDMRKQAMRMKLHKGTQPDDISVEVVRIILGCPTTTKAKAAVGWVQQTIGLSDFRERLQHMIAAALAAQRFPWQFHSTIAWTLDKGNGKTGCKGVRLIFGVLTLAKMLLTIVWKRGNVRPEPPNFVYHVAGKRREEAILVQEVNVQRMASRGMSTLRNFRDTANAFLSISQKTVIDSLEEAGTEPWAYNILEDHVLRNAFTIFSGTYFRTFRAKCGVFPGSSVGNQMFGLGAWKAQREWQVQRQLQGVSELLTFVSPNTRLPIDTSVTVFADDAGSCIAARSVEQLHLLDGRDDAIFDAAHAAINLSQNFEKAVRLLNVKGPGAMHIGRAISRNQGRCGRFVCAATARYLGPYLLPNATFTYELTRRLTAMNNNWCKWRKFWSSRASFWLKKLIFRCLVFQAMTSAAAAFVIEKSHYQKLATSFCKKCRSLMRGAACLTNPNGTRRNLSNLQVLEVLGYAPSLSNLQFYD